MLLYCIWLSWILAVVKSAAKGKMIEPIVLISIKCSLYPKIQPFVWLKSHHLASVSIPAERGISISSHEWFVPYRSVSLDKSTDAVCQQYMDQQDYHIQKVLP